MWMVLEFDGWDHPARWLYLGTSSHFVTVHDEDSLSDPSMFEVCSIYDVLL
jgi:hypothetical protein